MGLTGRYPEIFKEHEICDRNLAQARPLAWSAVLHALGRDCSEQRIRGQLTRESAYRLLVSGEIGVKELNKIIRVLTLQRELLSDSDDDEATADEA